MTWQATLAYCWLVALPTIIQVHTKTGTFGKIIFYLGICTKDIKFSLISTGSITAAQWYNSAQHLWPLTHPKHCTLNPFSVQAFDIITNQIPSKGLLITDIFKIKCRRPGFSVFDYNNNIQKISHIKKVLFSRIKYTSSTSEIWYSNECSAWNVKLKCVVTLSVLSLLTWFLNYAQVFHKSECFMNNRHLLEV